MKKKVVLILVIISLIMILGVKFISFGSKNYYNSELSSDLIVPRLSFLKRVSNNKVTFKSFRSKYSLQKELDKIMNNLDKKACHYDTYYYDSKNDITIEKYGIKGGFLLNEFYIVYGMGNYSNDFCNIITNPTLIEYDYFHVEENQEIKPLYKYLNEDGNLYDVYTTCDYCLSIRKGMGYFSYFEDLLKQSYMSMDDLISFLEHQVSKGDATKIVAFDGGSTLYKNKDFSLLKCHTLDGNKDIYFSDQLDDSINYCNQVN